MTKTATTKVWTKPTLASLGTINDVAMLGATPLYLSASFILEEGYPLADLKRIVESMARAAAEGHRVVLAVATVSAISAVADPPPPLIRRRLLIRDPSPIR